MAKHAWDADEEDFQSNLSENAHPLTIHIGRLPLTKPALLIPRPFPPTLIHNRLVLVLKDDLEADTQLMQFAFG